jgi:hypothetical protein
MLLPMVVTTCPATESIASRKSVARSSEFSWPPLLYGASLWKRRYRTVARFARFN